MESGFNTTNGIKTKLLIEFNDTKLLTFSELSVRTSNVNILASSLLPKSKITLHVLKTDRKDTIRSIYLIGKERRVLRP